MSVDDSDPGLLKVNRCDCGGDPWPYRGQSFPVHRIGCAGVPPSGDDDD